MAKKRLAIIHWVAAALAIMGALLVSFKMPAAGCGVWAVANLLWVVWAVARKDVPTTLVFVLDEIIAIISRLGVRSLTLLQSKP